MTGTKTGVLIAGVSIGDCVHVAGILNFLNFCWLTDTGQSS